MLPARVMGLEVIKSSGGEEVVKCPFHSDDNPSAWWNPKKGLFWCAVCMKGMNAYMLAKEMGIDDELVTRSLEEQPEDYDLFGEESRLLRGEQVYADYFRQRRIHERVAQVYGLEWRETSPAAAVLPIPDINSEVIGVVHRYVNPKEVGTRYKFFGETTPIWPMSNLRFLGREDRTIVVTEGAWSAMRLCSWGLEHGGNPFPYFALLGAKANYRVVETLQPFRVVFLYDNDIAGIRACNKMEKIKQIDWQCYTMKTSPDDMDDEQIERLLKRIQERL